MEAVFVMGARARSPPGALPSSPSSSSLPSSSLGQAPWLLLAGVAALAAVAATPALLPKSVDAAVVVAPGGNANPRLAARVMRIGGSSSSSNNDVNNNQDANNYSVSFVPLFSLIANFLPRLLARFAIKPPGSRSLDQNNKKNPGLDFLQHKGIFCSPEHVGRWKDISNCHQFYECQVKSDSPPGCQMFLSQNKNKQNANNKHKSKNIPQEDKAAPELIERYHTSCVTVSTYKCPEGYIYNDIMKVCDNINKDSNCFK